MCKKLTFLSCLGLLLLALPIVTATAQVTTADYLRADTFLTCSSRMYAAAVAPAWLDSSHYFWYKNHERGGDYYYLVNAKTGKKQRGTDKKQLASFLTGRQKPLAEILLKEEDKNENRRRTDEEAKPVVSPDNKWEAYIRDNNVYIRPAGEEKEKKKEYTELFVDLQIDLFSKKCPLLTNLRDKMRRKIAETGLDEELCSRLYERLEALPEHDKLCHGDFDLSNVILTDEGTPCILDWAHATIGNASADVAQTYLLFRLKGDIPGAENYLKLFCQKTGTAREYVEKWMPIVAACRMAKCNEKERGVLYSWVNSPDKY